MVRLEKVLYEKILNNKTLGRARNITTPRKWINVSANDYNAVQAGWTHEHSIFARIMEKVLYPFYRKFWWEWQRDLTLQRGWAMDDAYVYTEKDLRRSPFYEHMWRESCHPYQYLMYFYRRLRYYKVERVVQGFFVPDHLRDEVKNRTWAQTLRAMSEWERFMYRNYGSEITPTTYDSRGKINLLEVFNQYGFFRNEAWERYFYNEEDYDYIEPEDFERYVVQPNGCNLDTAEGRQSFEGQINTLIQDFPGLVTPEGESFDFDAFYMRWALLHQRDTTRFDQEKLDAAYDEIKLAIGRNIDPTKMLLVIDGEEAAVGNNTIGKEYPKRLLNRKHQALQN